MRECVIFLAFLFLSPSWVNAEIAINEVMFDPVGTDTGLEWLEIYNSGDASQDLSGWSLYPDGIGYFYFPQGFILKGRSFVTIRFRALGTNSEGELYHPSASSNMGNVSGSAAIFSGEPRGKETIKGFAEWGRSGETWESAAQDAGLWTRGTFVDISGISEGNSIMLSVDGRNDNGAGSWKIAVAPSPGTANGSGAGNISPPPNNTASSSDNQMPPVVLPPPSQSSASNFIPELHAYAGPDQETVAGALVSFVGYATGSKNEPLQNARFWWNFGDGDNKEGRSIVHAFSVPGEYAVGLHVSSDIYAVSDYLKVRVLNNRLSVADVVGGENGYLRLHNADAREVDIGGWIAEDNDSKRFIFPMKTKISENAQAAFANKITGILRDKADYLTLYYPNGEIALQWRRESANIVAVAPRVVNATSSDARVYPKPMPAPHLSSSIQGVNEITENSASTAAIEQAAAVSLAPNFFLIGALVVSFLGAVSFFLFKKSHFN